MTAPVRREVIVAASPSRAFELFTARIGDWWPLAEFSVFGDGTVAFEGSRLVERKGDEESTWGTVTSWDPPASVAFSWHPGYGQEQATDVHVTFEADGDQTLVTLVHTGWERMTDPDASAAEYNSGWPDVLAGYAALVTAAS